MCSHITSTIVNYDESRDSNKHSFIFPHTVLNKTQLEGSGKVFCIEKGVNENSSNVITSNGSPNLHLIECIYSQREGSPMINLCGSPMINDSAIHTESVTGISEVDPASALRALNNNVYPMDNDGVTKDISTFMPTTPVIGTGNRSKFENRQTSLHGPEVHDACDVIIDLEGINEVEVFIMI